MAYGQKPKRFFYWFYINQELLFLQPSTLTYSVDHTVLAEGKGSSTIPIRVTDLRIKVEILNICNNRSTAQAKGVGEIPLNGKGMPLLTG